MENRSAAKVVIYPPKLIQRGIRELVKRKHYKDLGFDALSLLYERNEAFVKDLVHLLCEKIVVDTKVEIAFFGSCLPSEASLYRKAIKELS